MRAEGWLTAVAARGRWLAGAAALGALAAAGLHLVQPTLYVAESSYVPHLKLYVGRTGGLMGSVLEGGRDPLPPATEAAEGPGFYAELVRSPGLLRAVARARYRVAVNEGARAIEGDLMELYRVEGATPGERLEEAVRILQRSVSGRIDLGSGLVTVRTVAPAPDLAEQINRGVLAGVREFIAGQRLRRAERRLDFARSRLRKAKAELARAEDELAAFLTRNRRYRRSPALRLEADRLRRRHAHLEARHAGWNRAHERVRLERADAAAPITVVDPPAGSPSPIGLGLSAMMALGSLVGLVAGLAPVLGAAWLGREARIRPRQYAVVRRRWMQMRGDLVRWARALGIARGLGADVR